MRIIQYRIHDVVKRIRADGSALVVKLVVEDRATAIFYWERGKRVETRTVTAGYAERRHNPSRWVAKPQVDPSRKIDQPVPTYEEYLEMSELDRWFGPKREEESHQNDQVGESDSWLSKGRQGDKKKRDQSTPQTSSAQLSQTNSSDDQDEKSSSQSSQLTFPGKFSRQDLPDTYLASLEGHSPPTGSSNAGSELWGRPQRRNKVNKRLYRKL